MSSPIPISLPRSKSIVIRCLIVNYLKTGTLLQVFDNDPNDIKVVSDALKTIDLQKNSSLKEECTIDVQDCGAAYRFFMAILAATPGKWLLKGTHRLLQRPILPLVNFLNAHGGNIQKTELGWRIEGKELQINDFEIDTSETSQYASAVMMITGERRKGERRKGEGRRETGEIPSPLEDKVADGGKPSSDGRGDKNPYLKMTETILHFYANGRDDARNAPTLSDWSAALFWLANALLIPNAHYLLKNLYFDNLQGDAHIVPYFKNWGLHFTETEHGIEVKHTHRVEIPAQKIDVALMPDTAMILAVLSVCYPFKLTMSGLKNINLKESNRLDILIEELSKFATVEKHSEEVITISKRTEKLPELFHFDSYNDHRFVIAWSLFKNFGTVNIQNADCVKKSYPDFY